MLTWRRGVSRSMLSSRSSDLTMGCVTEHGWTGDATWRTGLGSVPACDC